MSRKHSAELITKVERLASTGYPYHSIAKQVELTPSAIHNLIQHHDLPRVTESFLSVQQIARGLGVGHQRVGTWIRRGFFFKKRTPNPKRVGLILRITEEYVLDFLADEAHWCEWRADDITEPHWRRWAVECRKNEPRLSSVKDIARRFGYTNSGVLHLLRRAKPVPTRTSVTGAKLYSDAEVRRIQDYLAAS